MKLAFYDARIWRHLMSGIAKIIDEGVFVVSPEKGFTLRSMDPSHVAMLDMAFPVEAFDVFEVDEDRELGVNIEDLAKVLRRAGKNDQLELEADNDRFYIVFRSSRSYRRFGLPLLDITAESLPEPDLEFNARISLSPDAFRDIVKDVELVGDIVRLYADEDVFKAMSSSELGDVEIQVSRFEGEGLIEMDVKEAPQEASYTLDYFTDLLAGARVADNVVVEFSSEMPVKVTYQLPQGARFSFLVAPRVE